MANVTMAERFIIAHCALMVVSLVISLIVSFGIILRARRRQDPSRWCFTWLKILVALFDVHCITDLTASTLNIAHSRYYQTQAHDQYGIIILATLLQARFDVLAFVRLTNSLVVIFALVTLLSLSYGILMVHEGDTEREKPSRAVKFTALGLGIILGLVALTQCALRLKVYVEFYFVNYSAETGGQVVEFLGAASQLGFGFVVATMVLAVAMIGRAFQVVVRTRSETQKMSKHAVTLVSCSLLMLLNCVYEVAYQAKYINIQDIKDTPEEDAPMQVVQVILHIWPILTMICLLFLLGLKKKDDGVWTKQQSLVSYSPDLDIALGPVGPLRQQSLAAMTMEDAAPPAYSPPHSPVPVSPVTTIPQFDREWLPSPVSPVSPLSTINLPSRPGSLQPVPPIPQLTSPPIPSTPEAGPSNPVAGPSRVSPPEHEEAMGLYHQADGTPPQAPTLPYPDKR